jgi:hypothetical protein
LLEAAVVNSDVDPPPSGRELSIVFLPRATFSVAETVNESLVDSRYRDYDDTIIHHV